MVTILKFIWQLPQNIIALILLAFNFISYEKETINGITVYFLKHLMFRSGISLGNFILLDSIHSEERYRHLLDNTVKHEHGHQIQSLYLGPLYLIIVGLPSLFGNIRYRMSNKNTKWYYSRYPENWADKLGKVERTYL